MPKNEETAQVPIQALKVWQRILDAAGAATTISDYIPEPEPPEKYVMISLNSLREAHRLAGAGGRAEAYLGQIIQGYEKLLETQR